MIHEKSTSRPPAPLLAAAFAVWAGVVLGRAGVEPAWGTAAGVAIVAALAAWRWWRTAQTLALVALGVLAAERAAAWAPPATAGPPPSARIYEACVEDLVPTGSDAPAWTGLAWTRDDEGASRRLRLILAAPRGEVPLPEPGTRLRLRGTMRTAHPPRNPGEGDPRRAEADLGLDGGVWATAWTDVGRCEGFRAAALLARGRRAFAGLVQSALPPEEAGLALALTAGDASHVAPADFDAFQATGTVHVLSVSGMHLALVTWIVFLLVRGIALIAGRAHASAYDLRAVAAAAALAAAALYAGFAGLSLATARALVATMLMCAAALAGGKSSAWNAWSLGITVLLLVGPPAVRTPTFALSFLAVAGILAAGPGRSAPRFRVVEGGWGGWLRAAVRWMRGQVAVWPEATARMTAGAAAATAPVVAAWFGRVPALGLVANAAAIPLFSVALVPLLLAAVVQPFCEPLAHALVVSAWPWLAAGRAVVAMLAALPMCWLDVSLSPLGATGLSASVFAMLLLVGRARAAIGAGGLALAIAAAVVPARPPVGMEVTFLSVGQGDASVVRFASGGVLLVDTGPERSGRRVIVPFLRSLGVRKIDAIAISHAHPDHTGGLADVVRAFPVGELWLSGPIGADVGLDAARAPLAARGTRIVPVGRGAASRAFGRARVDFLAGDAALRDESEGERSGRNDRSLVLRIDDGRWSALFPGDVERPGEEQLVASRLRMFADVVKAPHHGSSTSSTTAFIRAASPRLAIAQTGLANRFGFPDAEVAARWRAAGSGWLNTAEEGAITVAACGTAPSIASGARGPPREAVERGICARSFVDPDRAVGY